MTNAEIELALALATREQLEKALKRKPLINRRRRIVGSHCPNGCGSIRSSRAMRRHLREECNLALDPGDASPNWMSAARAEAYPEGLDDVGLPPDKTAKYEIILRSGTRYTSVFIRQIADGRHMWNPGLFGVGLINAKDVLAWKVQEHFA